MPRELLDCTKCDHCCNYMTFTLPKRAAPEEVMYDLVKYYKAHGCIVSEDTYCVYITVKSPCLHKKDNGEFDNMPKGCDLHNTPAKPAVCRKYDCRNDPWLPVGGNYEKGKERP